jgi:hypothetical protein
MQPSGMLPFMLIAEKVPWALIGSDGFGYEIREKAF